MQENDIQNILSSLKASLDHPLFYPRIFALVSKHNRSRRALRPHALLDAISEEYEELSRRIDRAQIQESFAVRNVLVTRRLATLLIDEKGEIDVSILPVVIAHLSKHLYSLGPHRQYDAVRQEHILKVLKLLSSRKDLVFLLKKFTRPHANKWAEELIRQTLHLSPGTMIKDSHTRRAVLAAWMCYLRQNVGSCFATAPAEIIHDEQPEQFLHDLLELIALGSLKRTFGGIENSVPLSSSWGSGDLRKPLNIRLTSKGIVPEIWYDPALMHALELVGILKKEDHIKSKIQQMESWIKPIILKNAYDSISFTNSEDILRHVLLQALGVTLKQVKEYENRSQKMVQTQLLMQTQPSDRIGGVSDRCANFLYLFEIAKNSFKSLADNALLKAWEFTLASFSDIKYEFARWNLYASLGLGVQEPGGIGQCIYHTIQYKIDQANKKAQEIQYEYEMVYTQLKTSEARMRSASTEKELQWLKIEHQAHVHEFYFLEEQRNTAQNRATALVNLYENLYKLYVDLFKDYFQEVYDADMQEVKANPFDDSPAGFRLLYKHGRSNTSQWTRIKNQNDFIDSLAAFFVATETQIAHAFEGKGIERDLSDVITSIISHVRTTEFLETAFHRMAAAHHVPLIKNPLEHLDQIEKKPWVYTSGGTMSTLVSCYYCIEEKPKQSEKWVESEMELLVFLADILKQMPQPFIEPFLKGYRKSILMESPTHAFLLKPTSSPFNETWSNEEFTYTYIRDRFVRPAEIFVEKLLLNSEMIACLIQKISEKIPENFLPRFKEIHANLEGPLNPIFFRESVVHTLEHDRGLRYKSLPVLGAEEVDSLLYSSLPLCSINDLRARIQQIFSSLPHFTSIEVDHLMRLCDQIPISRKESYVTAQHVQSICKALLCLSGLQSTTSEDYHLLISRAAQRLGLAMPTPLIFADTNWVKEQFAFVVSPGTGRLELWRLDYTGSIGYPMTSWKQWLNGTRSDLRWGVYVKPFQYGQSSA